MQNAHAIGVDVQAFDPSIDLRLMESTLAALAGDPKGSTLDVDGDHSPVFGCDDIYGAMLRDIPKDLVPQAQKPNGRDQLVSAS